MNLKGILMKLTDEQNFVVQEVLNSIKTKPVVTLGGYAGTGKSTLVQHLTSVLDDWAVAAYTGKAANVLRKKGILDASTIHSLIYVPQKDASGNIVLDKYGQPTFVLNPNLDCAGILIDEASMVSQEIYNDLKTFNKPIIFVGDHGQLPPVGSDIHLMKKPDFKLEQIHRNAGEIARFAEFIRKGYRPQAFESQSAGVVQFSTKQQAENYFEEVDQIIVGFNKLRVEINKKIRMKLNKPLDWPVVGDNVMCLRNSRLTGLFNGMQGTVDYIYPKQKNKMIFSSDGKSYDVYFDPTQFNKEKYDFSGNRDDPHPFDFCDAVTAHKCQGDEIDDVLVIEARCDLWDFRRWAYTAASRAKVKLIWV